MATAMPLRCEPVRRLPLRCRCALRRGLARAALPPATCAPISRWMRARAAPASTACSSVLYATGRLGAFNVRTGASYSFDDIDASRGIFFPGFTDQTKARFHGNVGQVFGEVGYGMTFNHLAVEPMAGLAYVHLRDGSFLESGGAAALSGASSHENIGYSSLGVRMATFVPLANGTVLVPRAIGALAICLRRRDANGGARLPGHRHCLLGCRRADRAQHGAGRRRLRLALHPAGEARRVLSGRTRRERAEPRHQGRASPGIFEKRSALQTVMPGLVALATSGKNVHAEHVRPYSSCPGFCADEMHRLSSSCPTLGAGHPRLYGAVTERDVDGRNKSGHDVVECTASYWRA